MEGGGEKNMGLEVVAKTTPDKSRRDEWSEGGIMGLLNVYESKWLFRNRAKLKGIDWEDIAQQVSALGSGTKPVKTPNQCKNKIESMKKRYRVESSVTNNPGSGSLWQFYSRMDKLLKGTPCLQSKVEDGVANLVAGEVGSLQALPKLVDDLLNDPNKTNANGAIQAQVVAKAKHETIIVERKDHVLDSNRDDGSNTVLDNCIFSSPGEKRANAGEGSCKINLPKRRKKLGSAFAESIRMLASSILKLEQTRMDMYRDSERLRADTEIKRAEMDLKRTETMATTQLQIAKHFVTRTYNQNNKRGSSSSVAAESIVNKNPKEKNG